MIARASAGCMLVVLALGCPAGERPGGAGAAGSGSPGAAIFVDRAEQTGLRFEHRAGATGQYYFPEITGPGGALFDFDGDGDLDVYLVQGGRLGADAPGPASAAPGALFRNDLRVDGDGARVLRFTDVTAESGVRAAGYGQGVAAGDVDNDGDVDLYLTNFGANQLLLNDGAGRFREVPGAGGAVDDRWSTSAAFADFDRDGWLDLFVTTYVDFTLSNHRLCRTPSGMPNYCGPRSFDPTADRLFRNRGDGTFEDVSLPAGILSERGSGLGVVAADFDRDGWIDFYVANDQRPNHLWMNRGNGRFENLGMLSGAAVNMQGESESSMGVDAGDIDGDGDLDLFMTHLDGETNTLYLGDGHGFFEDRSNATRVGSPSRPFTGFGTLLVDYDNDGWLDILVGNGAVSFIEDLMRAGDPFPFGQTNQLFRNLGDGGFADVSDRAGEAFGRVEVTRGLALGDVDEDGDADALLLNTRGPARLLINQVGQDAHWLGLRLLDAAHGRDALGASVEVHLPDGRTLLRRARTDASYLSANDPRVLVGVGDATAVSRVRVFWPSGRAEEWTGPPLDRYSTLVEGEGEPGSE